MTIFGVATIFFAIVAHSSFTSMEDTARQSLRAQLEAAVAEAEEKWRSPRRPAAAATAAGAASTGDKD